MDKYYEGKGLVLYASKALCTMALCKIAEQEGLGLDVVSGGEIYTAEKAGFPMEKVYFHGNNKTPKELSEALVCGVGRIVVDNIHELKLLNEICARKGKKAQISVRVKPGVDAHTHDFVKTGQIDSKFGVALENGEVFEFAALTGKLDNVELVGLHCHIGSQIFDLLPFTETAEVMLNLISDLKEKYGIEITELNLGGGYGIKYTEDDDPVEYDRYIESVSGTVKKLCSEKGIEQPFMLMEPGRSIVAPAGLTLYTVGAVKDIENIRKYVAIDGGMFDNPRYALYESKYTFVLANKASELKSQIVTVAGKCCESGDLIGKDVELPEAEPGDIMAVLATGAYNYSMSMNYNRNGRPPMILVKDGKARIIVKGEDYEDIIRNDVIPEDL
jgi:diaminopimelate decarboxylase